VQPLDYRRLHVGRICLPNPGWSPKDMLPVGEHLAARRADLLKKLSLSQGKEAQQGASRTLRRPLWSSRMQDKSAV
jgi:hypothetical protein